MGNQTVKFIVWNLWLKISAQKLAHARVNEPGGVLDSMKKFAKGDLAEAEKMYKEKFDGLTSEELAVIIVVSC